MEEETQKRTRLNRGALAKVADAAAARRLDAAEQTSDVVPICTLTNQFYRAVLRQMEACDTVQFNELDVTLSRSDSSKGELKVDYAFFAEMCATNDLVFPKVIVASGCAELSNIKLTGIEQLSMSNTQAYARGRRFVLQLVSIIEANKSTLKVMLRIPKVLFDCLDELELEKLSVAEDVLLDDFQIPALNTKIFECVDVRHTPIPAPFMRMLGADEIHLNAYLIEPLWHAQGNASNNTRVKKLSVTFCYRIVDAVDFARIFVETAAYFPQLERFELRHDIHVAVDDRRTLRVFNKYADNLVSRFEHILEQADYVHYSVQMKTKLCFRIREKLWLLPKPVESDFDCGLRVVPPDGVTPPDKNRFCFLKESHVHGHSLRVDLTIVQEPQSSSESESGSE